MKEAADIISTNVLDESDSVRIADDSGANRKPNPRPLALGAEEHSG